MRVGVSLTSRYDVDDVRAGVAAMVERAGAARDAGLDVLSIGDHHADVVPYYQNTPMLGRLLAEWDDRPAGCLFLMPLWPPVLMAEQIGTLAAIAEGPFVVQTGLGTGAQQFAAMGADLSTRAPVFEEQVRVVKALLAGETVSSALLDVDGAAISPVPPEPVEWWIGAGVDVAIERAARLGDAWYASPHLTPDTARAPLETYLRACERHGREPTRVALRRDVYVAATDAEAERVVEPIVASYRGLAPEALAIGSVERVAEGFDRFAQMGFTDIVARHITVSREQAVASIGLLGDVRAQLRA